VNERGGSNGDWHFLSKKRNTDPGNLYRKIPSVFSFLLHYNLYTGAIHRSQYKDMLTKLTGMPYSKSDGYGAVMYNLLLSRQQRAINNAETVLAEISHGNPAEEESSTTVQRLVVELNKYL